MAFGAKMPPLPNCPANSATLCVKDPENPGQGYDWFKLYSTVLNIKKKFPEETIVTISASPNTPFSQMVRAMDTLRFVRLTENGQAPTDMASFSSSARKPCTQQQTNCDLLFNDVILTPY